MMVIIKFKIPPKVILDTIYTSTVNRNLNGARNLASFHCTYPKVKCRFNFCCF